LGWQYPSFLDRHRKASAPPPVLSAPFPGIAAPQFRLTPADIAASHRPIHRLHPPWQEMSTSGIAVSSPVPPRVSSSPNPPMVIFCTGADAPPSRRYRQVLTLRQHEHAELAFMLMNSFATSRVSASPFLRLVVLCSYLCPPLLLLLVFSLFSSCLARGCSA
jgi:hypothetical protein